MLIETSKCGDNSKHRFSFFSYPLAIRKLPLSYILDNTFDIINRISYVLVEGQTQLYKMYARVSYILKLGSFQIKKIYSNLNNLKRSFDILQVI